MAVEYDPTLDEWPVGDPTELLEFVQGVPDDGLRRLATAVAKALIQYQQIVTESEIDRADLRARVEALEGAN